MNTDNTSSSLEPKQSKTEILDRPKQLLTYECNCSCADIVMYLSSYRLMDVIIYV